MGARAARDENSRCVCACVCASVCVSVPVFMYLGLWCVWVVCGWVGRVGVLRGSIEPGNSKCSVVVPVCVGGEKSLPEHTHTHHTHTTSTTHMLASHRLIDGGHIRSRRRNHCCSMSWAMPTRHTSCTTRYVFYSSRRAGKGVCFPKYLM